MNRKTLEIVAVDSKNEVICSITKQIWKLALNYRALRIIINSAGVGENVCEIRKSKFM